MNRDYLLDRIVRVFVSSTFRDMQAERSHLVEAIFPRVQQYCKAKDVYFVPLDLRWGITYEQSESGQVAEVCLEAIKRSKPFFIGLLGERYGWTPDIEELNKNPRLRDRFSFLKNDFAHGLSITEVEMQYGVLRESEPMNAAFWLRSKEMPTPEEFRESPGTEDAEKLQKLKRAICSQTRYPVGEYTSVEDLGKQVEEAIQTLVDQLFPREGLTWLERLLLQQNSFMRFRTRLYVHRQSDYDRLNRFVDGNAQKMVITGALGNGKSALLVNWIATRRGEMEFIPCFIGASTQSESPEDILRLLIAQLDPDSESVKPKDGNQPKLDEKPKTLDDLSRELAAAIAIWLRNHPDKKMVLVMDGINQIPDFRENKLLNWIPLLPDTVKIICTSWVTDPTMAVFERRGFESMDLLPLDFDQRQKIIVDFLAERNRNLLPEQVARIASDEECGSPIVLRTLLDELCYFGSHEELDHHIDWYLSAESQEAFFDRVLERIEQSFGEEPVRALLSILASSHYGLTNDELLTIAKSQYPNSTLFHWQQIAFSLDNHFIKRDGLDDFAHGLIRSAALSRYEKFLPAARHAIIDYFQTAPLKRRCEEVPYQFATLNDLHGLKTTLVDYDVLTQMCDLLEFIKYWYRLFDAGYKLDAYFELDVSSRPPEAQASGYFNLAYFGASIGNFKEQERGYSLALELYRELAAQNPDAYRQYVAMTLNNLGALHNDTNRHEAAEAEYTESLELYRELAAQNPDAYRPDVAETARNLGILYEIKLHDYPRAEAAYRESVEAYEQLCAMAPGIFEQKLEQVKGDLADAIRKQNSGENHGKKMTIPPQGQGSNGDKWGKNNQKYGKQF